MSMKNIILAKNTANCKCEQGSVDDRIACLYKHYNNLQMRRQCPHTTLPNANRNMQIQMYQIVLFEIPKLPKGNFPNYPEACILLSFYRKFVKTHRKFEQDGPNIKNLNEAVSFYSFW